MENKRILIVSDKGAIFVYCPLKTTAREIYEIVRKYYNVEALVKPRYVLKLGDYLRNMDKEKSIEFIKNTKTINMKGEVI